jgi:hypothetical protein
MFIYLEVVSIFTSLLYYHLLILFFTTLLVLYYIHSHYLNLFHSFIFTMSFIRSIILLGIAATTSYASPLSLNLFNRDGGACYPESMTIDQPDQNCPKKNTLDSSGHCSATIPNVPGSHGCTAYCELTLAVGYGQEVPITEGSCQELTSCVVTTGQSVTVTHSYSISTKVGLSSTDNLVDILTSAFELGASYSWSKAIAYTVTTSHTETLKANQCGYWTFIPYVMTYALPPHSLPCSIPFQEYH